MSQENAWGAEFVTNFDSPFGMESFLENQSAPQSLIQGRPDQTIVPWFNPAHITVEKGVFYASLYVCRLADDMTLTQRLAVWFNSLKETDHVRLSVSATVTGIPFACLMTILSAIANTKAYVEIILDQIVMDGLAYFYLLADKISARHAGGLFLQSYVDQRREDTGNTWKAVHDFYQWIVEDAVLRGFVTAEEAAKINNGQDVELPVDRFST